MNNNLLQGWRHYMKDATSPDSFIDMGFYFMIGTALQRRVWVGPERWELYPNTYVVLVGKPGLGKTMVLKQIISCLKENKLFNSAVDTDAKGTKDVELPLLFPVAPENTTFESLARIMAKSVRSIKYLHTDESTGETKKKIYTHNSLCFMLEELSSLFHKNADQVVKFLLAAYDNGDYTKDTKTQGVDRIRKPCLSLIGGAPNDFMQESFDNKLIGQGFTSRTIFVYESAKRFERFEIRSFDNEQKKAREDIVKWLKQLGSLYGQVRYTPEAKEFFRYYFEEIHPYERPNKSTKLEAYYERKNIHAQKLAMAVHFSQSLDMTINQEACAEALRILEKLEAKMHLALTFVGKNPLGGVSKEITKYLLINGVATLNEIWKEFVGDVSETELAEVMRFLLSTNQVEVLQKGNTRYYSAVTNKKGKT